MLAPDLPGHGESGKPPGDYSLGNLAASVRDLLRLLEVERVTVDRPVLRRAASRCSSPISSPTSASAWSWSTPVGSAREVSWILRLATLPAAEFVDAGAVPLVRPQLG